jgi:hypothetical protein
MGTDIHSLAQAKKDGEWVTVAERVAGDDRNYHTFSILAGVRNGYGFAGVRTGEPWEPISEPRGLPKDLGKNTDYGLDDEMIGDLWIGDHSHSWLTLEDLELRLERMEHESYMNSGVVTVEEYKECVKNNSAPGGWCGDISGRGIVVVHSTELASNPAATHVRMEWAVPALEAAWSFPLIVKALCKIRGEAGVQSKDVPLCFWV